MPCNAAVSIQKAQLPAGATAIGAEVLANIVSEHFKTGGQHGVRVSVGPAYRHRSGQQVAEAVVWAIGPSWRAMLDGRAGTVQVTGTSQSTAEALAAELTTLVQAAGQNLVDVRLYAALARLQLGAVAAYQAMPVIDADGTEQTATMFAIQF